MAIIERVTLPALNADVENNGTHPGLRISIRSTTSSLSDYPEWRLEEIAHPGFEKIITDGACS